MRRVINQKTFDLAEESFLMDAIALTNAKPPFAVAVNMQFIPKNEYAQIKLTKDDQIEIISPITGG